MFLRYSRSLIASQVTLLALLGIACNSNKASGNSSNASTVGTPAASPGSSVASNSEDAAACKLVTKAEAEQVMGEKLKDADFGPASMQGGSICTYGSPESLSARNVTIRIESPNYNWDKNKEDKRIEGEKMAPKKGRIREVPGLGKSAYFARHVLHVQTDHGILTVIIFKDTADAIAGEETETKTEALEKTLAEKAVTRM